MIDIVSFILPEEKNSVHSFAESVQYIEKNTSVNKIIATPLVDKSDLININDKLIVKIDRINKQLSDYKIDSKILLGLKVKIFPELAEEKYINEIICLDRRFNYVILELPDDVYPKYIHELCYQLQMKGITPILNAVEQKSYFQEDPVRLYRLVKNGSITQIQAASIVGQHGKKVRNFAQQIIESNQAHLIHTDITKEIGMLKQALNTIEKKYGVELAQYFQTNASAIWTKDAIKSHQPSRVKGKFKLKFW